MDRHADDASADAEGEHTGIDVADVGAEVRVAAGSWRHRMMTVILGGAFGAVGAAILGAGLRQDWARLTMLGGLLAVAGILIAAFGVRALGDRLVIHEHGLVRHSRLLGTKRIRFDAVTALRTRPPPPAAVGAVEVHAGDALMVVDRTLCADIDDLLGVLEARSGATRDTVACD